jgi:putative ABC transport system substrate-binding protein
MNRSEKLRSKRARRVGPASWLEPSPWLVSVWLVSGLIFLFLGQACRRESPSVYRIGYFQVVDSVTANEARRGFLQALQESGLWPSPNLDIEIRNALGEVQEVQAIAQEFVRKKKNLIIAHSTPCLQAALMATREIPVIFLAVANPYLINAGRSAEEHLPNVTGVASTGPIRQTLILIKEVLPLVRKVGTLWTPSEINSEYYLQLAKEAAAELNLELVTVPVSSPQDVLIGAQILVSKKIDCFFPISDNTINASFTSIARVAEENSVPLFGSFLLAAHSGACAALGLDFFSLGYEAGKLAVRVKNGESPGDIPFLSPQEIKLYLNLLAAKKQGVTFPPDILKKADEIITVEEDTQRFNGKSWGGMADIY